MSILKMKWGVIFCLVFILIMGAVMMSSHAEASVISDKSHKYSSNLVKPDSHGNSKRLYQNYAPTADKNAFGQNNIYFTVALALLIVVLMGLLVSVLTGNARRTEADYGHGYRQEKS